MRQQIFSITLDEQRAQRLASIAEREAGCNRSEAVRILIDEACERRGLCEPPHPKEAQQHEVMQGA